MRVESGSFSIDPELFVNPELFKKVETGSGIIILDSQYCEKQKKTLKNNYITFVKLTWGFSTSLRSPKVASSRVQFCRVSLVWFTISTSSTMSYWFTFT